MWNNIKVGLSVLLLVLLSVACTDDSNVSDVSKIERTKVKIAVILPLDKGGVGWNRILEWVRQNIKEANTVIEPEYEIYDENGIDLDAVATDLAGRKDIIAVIGCYSSANTELLARKCARTYKPVFTFSTSNELPRAFGQRNFLWGLAESDITQSELLLIKAACYGAKRVSLLAADDIYGKTFTDWFAFQAVELGLEVADVESYGINELPDKFRQAIGSRSDCLICVPSSVEDACRMVERYEQSEYRGRLLFSDMAHSGKLISTLGVKSNGIEGISLSSDPSTGFDISYQVNFGVRPAMGEAYVYDAVMIICYAYRYAVLHGLEINEAIANLLNGKATETGMWTSEAMEDIFMEIEKGNTPIFSGASGNLDFSPDNYTLVQYSTYVHWMAYEGAFINLDYDTRSDSHSMYAAWEWNKQFMQQFDAAEIPDIVYPGKIGNWAVVVAASQNWINYRHQADALAFYQMLKRNGYDDEHIILIMADDIAQNDNNPEKGVVRRIVDGENLYRNVQIDYWLSELSPENLRRILIGEGEGNDLKSGAGDNVIFFWSGHGEKYEWLWGDDDSVSADLISETFRQMSEKKMFRKMLCFIETCYSGSVAEKCCGIPGLLMFTAANPQETSKADVFNNNLNVWMTNRFTSVLLEQTRKNSNISLRELYLAMFHQTLGSHVSVYNVDCYGNIYRETMGEFLCP